MKSRYQALLHERRFELRQDVGDSQLFQLSLLVGKHHASTLESNSLKTSKSSTQWLLIIS